MPPPAITKQQALAALAAAGQASQDQDRDGLADLSMEELAARAGVSRATLYRLFGSQQSLLQELGVEAPPMVRSRILDTALDLVGRHGLAELSMEELAAAAGVSRATLYRLFPGKAALFPLRADRGGAGDQGRPAPGRGHPRGRARHGHGHGGPHRPAAAATVRVLPQPSRQPRRRRLPGGCGQRDADPAAGGRLPGRADGSWPPAPDGPGPGGAGPGRPDRDASPDAGAGRVAARPWPRGGLAPGGGRRRVGRDLATGHDPRRRRAPPAPTARVEDTEQAP